MLMCALLGAVDATAGESAADLLGRAASKYRSAGSITAGYTLKADGAVNTGTITVAGTRFKITSKEMQVWFDGKTQWTYVPSSKEVSVTEPDADEQQQMNPFAVINAFRTHYNVAYGDKAGGRTRTLKLTPKSKRADITQVTVKLDTTTLFPTEITLKDRSGRLTVIKVTGARTGAAPGVGEFRYNAKSHPGVKVVDLR